MIKNILDNYFSNLLIRRIENYTKLWCCKFKAEKSEGVVTLYIKKYKYEDRYYKEIFSFSKENAFELLFDKDLPKEIREIVEKVLED